MPRAAIAARSEHDPLTLRDINRATLARQMLLAREAVAPLKAIERLAGLQAQWPKPPHLGLWSRLEGFERGALLALLGKRQAVRATMMRGTLHVVSAKDYVALRPIFQPMLTRAVAAVLRERMKGIVIDEVVAEAREVLHGKPATFEDVRDALAKLHPRADARAMGFVVRMSIPLVQVPRDEGGEDAGWGYPTAPAFAMGEDWVGKRLSASTTMATLVLRYLAAFGPGTASDVQTWSGVQGAKEAVEALRPKLVVLRDERKRELFDLPDAPRPGAGVDAPVRFLPAFDNLVLAHTDRRRFVADEHRKRVYLPGLRIAPTFLVDGFVAGTWGTTRTKKDAVLTITSFAPLAKKAKAALADEAERLVRFAEPAAATFAVRFA
ncbi:MAG TPA: winged helix DNA-binding domain-containing protein [Polyangiaceae bacterium]|jgi:hypothetical protein|nr:winged helix DNA-binding domain-containing protein [Polyangiaceae bacterium]